MTVYRSERERRDEQTGQWQLLNEIMEAIRCEYQSPQEVIDALTNALAKVIVQADCSDKWIEDIKEMLDSSIRFQRGLEFSDPRS